MGRLKNTSVIGECRGKIGPVVMSSWKSIPIIKSAPIIKNSTKRSEKQIRQSSTFSMVMDFLSPVTAVIDIGFQEPRNAKMTRLNKATSYHLLNAVVNDPLQSYIDLAKVKFSCPIRSTQCAWNAELMVEEGRKIMVNWELNPFPQKCTQLNDRVILVFYDRDINLFLEFLPGLTERNTLSFAYVVPKQCIGHDLFGYMLMVSADGKRVSETEYLGMVEVPA